MTMLRSAGRDKFWKFSEDQISVFCNWREGESSDFPQQREVSLEKSSKSRDTGKFDEIFLSKNVGDVGKFSLIRPVHFCC